MADTSIGLDVLEAFDISPHFALKITFENKLLDNRADFVLLFDCRLFGTSGVRNFRLVKNMLGARTTYSI